MKQEALKYFSETHLTVLGLMIFFIFFVGMVLWTNRKTSKPLYDRLSHLPFQEEENHGN